MQRKGENYRKAFAIELIHKQLKDQEIIDYQEKLFLNGFKGFMGRYIHLLNKIIYYSITYIFQKRSLGEEYCYLLLFHPKQNIFIHRRRIVIYILLQCFFNYIVKEIGSQYIEKLQKLARNKLTQNQDKDFFTFIYLMLDSIPNFQQVELHFQELHTGVFFYYLNYYEFQNRLTRLQYLNVFPSNEQSVNYKPISIVILLTKLTQFSIFVKTILNKYKMYQPLQIDDVKQDSSSQQESDICKICLDKRTNTTSTLCGHIYCWDCIFRYSQIRNECPLCRSQVHPKELIFLQNFSQILFRVNYSFVPKVRFFTPKYPIILKIIFYLFLEVKSKNTILYIINRHKFHLNIYNLYYHLDS